MLENSIPIKSADANRAWTVREARTIFLTVVIISALFLILKSLIFLPQPTERPFLITKPTETEIIKALEWYAKNSAGSLKLENNRCILEASSNHVLCKTSLETKKSSKDLKTPLNLKENPVNWPYIWRTKAYDEKVSLEFALFTLEPVKIISHKMRATVLGEELIVEVEFKQTALTPVVREMLSAQEIKNLEKEIGNNLIGKINFLPNPYGHYLPIYPLP